MCWFHVTAPSRCLMSPVARSTAYVLSRAFSRSRVSKTSTPCSWAATNQSRRSRAYVPQDDGAGQFSVGRNRNHSLATAVARNLRQSSNRRSSSTRNAIPSGIVGFPDNPQDSQPSLE